MVKGSVFTILTGTVLECLCHIALCRVEVRRVVPTPTVFTNNFHDSVRFSVRLRSRSPYENSIQDLIPRPVGVKVTVIITVFLWLLHKS